VLDAPLVTDGEYDQLYRELKNIEDQNPDLVTADSPTQIVGAGPIMDNRLTKVFRAYPMLSIDNSFTEDDVKIFCKNYLRKGQGLCCEPKMDGLALELKYKDGVLVRASTRGDGLVGEDVTHNALCISNIPSIINHKGQIEIRGEAFINKLVFANVNAELVNKGDKPFANTRNAVAGSMRQLNPLVTRGRQLSFFAYGISVPSLGLTQYEFLQKARDLGFETSEYIELCHNVEEVFAYYRRMMDIRPQLNYDIDGVVIKMNSFQALNLEGNTNKTPRGYTAYKFPPSEASTRLLSVTYSVGRTGAITPVANLQPVALHGVIVSNATLHNWDEIGRLGVMVNDVVVVERAGDVIPKIVGVLSAHRDGSQTPILPPERCPECGALVEKEDIIYYCSYPLCKAQTIRSLGHFVSRDAFNIDGVGPALIESLVEQGVIEKRSDLLKISKEQLLSVPLVGIKKANNILDAIESAIRNIDEPQLLFSLGIRHIGIDVSKLLLKKFGTVENTIKATKEELLAIHGIGQVLADSILRCRTDLPFLQELVQIRSEIVKVRGVPYISAVQTQPSTDKFKGMTVVITGTFIWPRPKIKEYIESHGGKVTGSVTGSTTHVLVGDNPGANKTSKVQNQTVIGPEKIQEFLGVASL